LLRYKGRGRGRGRGKGKGFRGMWVVAYHVDEME